MAARPHNFAGFTLFELVLVLLLLAIMAGMAAPSLRNFAQGRNAPDAANQIVTLTRWAHTQAVAEGRNYRLNLSPATGQYQVTTEEGNASQTIASSMGQMFKVADGVTIDASMPSNNGLKVIHFYPNGRTEPGTIKIDNGSQHLEVVCLSAAENYYLVAAAGGDR
jgi:type II secretion system protein H